METALYIPMPVSQTSQAVAKGVRPQANLSEQHLKPQPAARANQAAVLLTDSRHKNRNQAASLPAPRPNQLHPGSKTWRFRYSRNLEGCFPQNNSRALHPNNTLRPHCNNSPERVRPTATSPPSRQATKVGLFGEGSSWNGEQLEILCGCKFLRMNRTHGSPFRQGRFCPPYLN